MNLHPFLIAIEVGGTIAFAMSGLIEATRKRMDIVGVFSVAFVSAFGGGTVRDLLLDRRPLFWVQNQEYVWLVIALALTAPALKDDPVINVPDEVKRTLRAKPVLSKEVQRELTQGLNRFKAAR